MNKFQLTTNSKVSKARTPLQDGEYQATIKTLCLSATTMDADTLAVIEEVNDLRPGTITLDTAKDANPYILFNITSEERDTRFYINSDTALDIITSNLNRQLDIDPEDKGFFEWFADVAGATVTLWLLTTTASDGKQYQNVTPYKPTGFDDIMNGAL